MRGAAAETAMEMGPEAALSRRAHLAGGQPISDLMSRALANPDLISLAAGFVDGQTLPVEPTRQALEAVFADADQARAALQYGTTPGYPPLREALLEQMQIADGPGASQSRFGIDQIVVTAGSNQLLHLVGESLLDPGDIVLCAAPTYLVFLGTLGNIGARSVGVTSDQEGVLPDALEETFRRLERSGELPRVKAIYLVPYFDNPQGVTMPLARRAAVVEAAKRWSKKTKIHVIEDAAYRELRYTGEDIPSTATCDDDGSSVVVAGTFSKSFSPGIRIGWGALPRHLVEPVCAQKGNIDFGSPNMSQHLMAKVLERGLFRPHVEQIRTSYRIKMDAMLAACREHLAPLGDVSWIEPRGGLYVWVTLPEHIDAGPDGRLFDAAIAEGVLYVPGQYCYPAEGERVHKNTIRLSFGVQTPDRIGQGVAALARAIERVA